MRTAVFFDRDGVLNVDSRDPIILPGQLALLPGAARAVRRINNAGLPAVVVTNQAVVARGLIDVEGLERMHDRLRELLLQEAGARLDAIYYCPHHPNPTDPTRIEALCVPCECRKPQPGLLLRAAREMDLDLAKSAFIGDSTKDVAAGQRAGVRTILVTGTGNGGRDGLHDDRADFSAPDVGAAVNLALSEILR